MCATNLIAIDPIPGFFHSNPFYSIGTITSYTKTIPSTEALFNHDKSQGPCVIYSNHVNPHSPPPSRSCYSNYASALPSLPPTDRLTNPDSCMGEMQGLRSRIWQPRVRPKCIPTRRNFPFGGCKQQANKKHERRVSHARLNPVIDHHARSSSRTIVNC